MEIRDDETGCFVRLTPIRYQFPDSVGVPYDSDWLIIRGHVKSQGEEWAFQDPCLMAGEAVRIGSWLRAVAAGIPEPMTAREDGYVGPTVVSVEPNLGFGVVRYGESTATIRIFLWLESSPPSMLAAEKRFEFFLDLTASRDDIAFAAHAWLAELADYPERS